MSERANTASSQGVKMPRSGHRLPSRPGFAPPASSLQPPTASDAQRVRQLDAGVLQTLEIQAKSAITSEVGPRHSSRVATVAPGFMLQRFTLADVIAKAGAIARHTHQQQRIANIITQGLAIRPNPRRGTSDRDNLLRNSCEWIQQGQCQLFILSPIHDSATRDPSQGVAYFDTQTAYPNVGGDYPVDTTVTADPHLHYGDADDLGGLHPGGARLDIVNPQNQSDDAIRETLIHEVQHDADQTWPGQVWAVPGGSSYNDYQSEFRSYWIEGPRNDRFGSMNRPARNNRKVSFTDPAGTTHEARTRFLNRRQENVFWFLVDAGYDYVPRMYTTDRAFRRMVNNFSVPLGGNLINSVRIQAVSQALTACNVGSARNSPEVTALFAAVAQLDALDRQMLTSRRSRPFWQQARSRLSAAVYQVFSQRVRRGR